MIQAFRKITKSASPLFTANASRVCSSGSGRGTSTFDGLSIAWSVSEFLAREIKSRAIFATHYHELKSLAETSDNISNFQVLVEETGKDLHFLHKVAPGGATRSYGIEAARLAGVPQGVIQRAHQILEQLQTKSIIHQKELKKRANEKSIPSAASFNLNRCS